MVSSRLFITGSGTEIGKTFLARALIAQLRRQGVSVDAIKPVITGFDAAKAAESDAGLLLSALGLPIDDAHLDRMSPWRFGAPLSPDLAAARENREIPFDALLDFSSGREHADVVLIEGVGGVMVPLDRRHTVVDWIAMLEIETVLVTGTYLGAISHALTAREVLELRGIPLRAIVVSESVDPAVPALETVGVLERFCGNTKLLVLPRVGTAEEAPDLSSLLEPATTPAERC
jgi:dethiobiotin synthetase